MPPLWPAGPWRFEAAVTITECNEQSVTNWLQFAQIAESGGLRAEPAARLPVRRSPGSVRPRTYCTAAISAGHGLSGLQEGQHVEGALAMAAMAVPGSAADLQLGAARRAIPT